MKTGRLLIALLAGCTVFSFVTGCSKPPGELYDEAIVATTRGDFERAQRKLKVVVARDPEFVDAHFQLGKIYEIQRETDKARECYDQVVALQPTHSLALFALGQIYFRENRFDKALEQVKPVVEAQGTFSVREKVQAQVLMRAIEKNKDVKSKIDSLESQSKTDENVTEELSDAYHLYGKLLVERQMMQQAIEVSEQGSHLRKRFLKEYEARLRDHPTDAELSKRLGALYYKEAEVFLLLKDISSAVDSLRQTINYDPSVAKYHFALAQLAHESGSATQDELVELVKKAVELEPDNAQYHLSLAGFYCGVEDYRKGKAELEKVLELDPNPKAEAYARNRLKQLEQELAGNKTP